MRKAAVVKIIFDKYVKEGFGPQRTATFLNNNGYRARTGKMWHPASIRGILGNLTYTGVLRCGDARSEQIPELKIISTEQFEAAQHIREARSNENRKTPIVPLNTKGESLLAGNVYCGHCGARLTLTTNGRYRKLSCGLVDTTQRVRYVCYGKTRKQTQCDGPTGYTILSFADLYDSAGIEAKKMVVSAMIRRVEVSRDYKLTIYFNFNLDQFLHGLDCGGTIQAGGV